MFTRSTSLRQPTAWQAIALFFVLVTVNSYGRIDLTPFATEYAANGMKFQQLVFKDEKRRVEYEPPTGWKFDGSANQVRLTPRQKAFAEAIIAATPLTKPQVFDENTLKAVEQQLTAGLPVGSQFAKIEETVPSPVLLDGNASVEMTISYQVNGEKFLRSALFVNLPDTQLVFRLTARKDDFPALHREFKGSILSWHWVEEKSESAQPSRAEPDSLKQ